MPVPVHVTESNREAKVKMERPQENTLLTSKG
jgi:hypothetical protein